MPIFTSPSLAAVSEHTMEEPRRKESSVVFSMAAFSSPSQDGFTLRPVPKPQSSRKASPTRPKNLSLTPAPYNQQSKSAFTSHLDSDQSQPELPTPCSPMCSPIWGMSPWAGLEPVSPSHHSSTLSSSAADDFLEMPMPDLVGHAELKMAMQDDETASKLLKFARSRGCGQDIEFLLKVGDYAQALKRVDTELAAIADTYMSNSTTSSLHLPENVASPQEAATKNALNSVIPSLQDLFDNSKAFIEQKVARDIFPAFVKHQLTTSMSVALAFGADAGEEKCLPKFPGLVQSFCLSDPSEPGNPIECASDGLEKLFGYARSDVLGQGCRIFQGPLTDKDALSRMEDAMHRGRDFSELVVNYRANGEPFWNLLHVCPLLGGSGRVRKYLGGQIDVSASLQSGTDLLKMLNYDMSEDIKNRTEREEFVSSSPPRCEPPSDIRIGSPEAVQAKPSRKGLFKSFKKAASDAHNSPAAIVRSGSRLGSRDGPVTPVSTSSTKGFGRRGVQRMLAAPRESLPSPYSRYIILQHVPSYPASLSASALRKDAGMRSGVPARLNIAFCSEAVIEVLGLGMAADAIKHRDIFDVLAEQANCASVTREFKSEVRRAVLMDGRSTSMELAMRRGPMAMRKAAVSAERAARDAEFERLYQSRPRTSVGASATGPQLERMMSYWTPLKDADDEVQYVMVVLSAATLTD